MTWHVFSRLTWRGRRWFFSMKARNGEIVLQSEGYRNKGDALQTVGRVKVGAAEAPVVVEP